MKYKNLGVLLYTLPFLAVISGCTTVRTIDFTPRDISCDGNPWTWDDVATFQPEIIIEEEDVVSADVSYVFEVKEERSWWFDRKFGEFRAFFRAGERTPHQTLSLNTNYVPQGAPQPSSEGFWLVCTRLCRLKGNEEDVKDDDGSAKVYIVQSGWMAGTANVYRSDPHLIECTRAGTGGSGSGGGICPAGRPDCCWKYSDGRCGECIDMAAGQRCQ